MSTVLSQMFPTYAGFIWISTWTDYLFFFTTLSGGILASFLANSSVFARVKYNNGFLADSVYYCIDGTMEAAIGIASMATLAYRFGVKTIQFYYLIIALPYFYGTAIGIWYSVGYCAKGDHTVKLRDDKATWTNIGNGRADVSSILYAIFSPLHVIILPSLVAAGFSFY